MNEKYILQSFLKFPIWTSDPVFEKFKTIEGCIYRTNPNNKMERFLFINGKKQNKVILIAHADTFFDEHYHHTKISHNVIEKDGFFYGINENGHSTALGADDRAGCAILWLLKDTGHSLLITDGEEHGRKGSSWLMNNNPDIAEIINNHQFMIQVDRRNSTDFKCYDVGTEKFRKFINEKTGYNEPDKKSFTDICTLCKDICGVNFSIGYYNEHTNQEKINISEWLNTLNILKKLLHEDLPKFIK